MPLEPDRYVHTLSVGERQRIEVVRCLLQSPSLLIMDEPTSVLTPQEVGELFKTLRRLSEEGVSILYISHKLHEIKELCHTATIMRMGEVVAACTPKEETPRSMAEMMMGANLVSPERIDGKGMAKPQLAVKHLNVKSPHQYGVNLRDISFSVRGGEVFGIAGIAGNGQRELMEVLSGEIKAGREDIILIGDQSVGLAGPTERRKAGMGFVPEERLGHGAVPELSLWENAFLTAAEARNLSNKGFIRVTASNIYAEEIVKNLN